MPELGSPLQSLVYLSTAIHPFSESQLVELLHKSREHNARAGITGLLLYKRPQFMQLIEGPEAAVHSLCARIRIDPRHCGMVTLLDEPLAARTFPEWSMAFQDLESRAVRELPGFSLFLDAPLMQAEFQDATRAQKLLGVFRRIMCTLRVGSTAPSDPVD